MKQRPTDKTFTLNLDEMRNNMPSKVSYVTLRIQRQFWKYCLHHALGK